jgi:hypothetical protein
VVVLVLADTETPQLARQLVVVVQQKLALHW